MNDIDVTPKPPTGEGGSTTFLFLALYLLVLAFFILMVTISTFEDVKSKAVMDSLTSTFASLLPPVSDLTAFTGKEGNLLNGPEFQDEITGIFSTAIKVAKVEVVQPGRLMRVLLPADSLFFPEQSKIREGLYPMLDRIVATLSRRPPGLRYDMEFVIDSSYARGESLAISETLEMSRAGVFAREMLSRGAPGDSVSIGMRPGDEREISIWFYVRFEDEEKLRFESMDE